MKKLVRSFVVLLGALVLFASCTPGPVNYDIKFGEMQYLSGGDKVHAEVTSDNDNVMVRDAKCWWTFDGSEPTKDSKYKNFDNWQEPDKDFDLVIPSDFYEGKIKFLCEITYFAMGKKEKETKKITKSFSTKYHSVTGIEPELYKNKGLQKEYSISTTAQYDSRTYTVKEDGTLKINFLMGKELFTVDAQSPDSSIFTKQVTTGETVTVSYRCNIVANVSSASGTKSGEYLIIVE